MADFSALKTSIQNYIKQNGNEEITGNLLQQILLSMVTTLGDSAINDLVTALNAEIANRGNADTTLQGNINSEAAARGNADTELGGRITTLQGVVNGIIANIENGYVYAGIATPSTTPASGKVFYLALTAGTYTNFGATVVPQGINILKYNGSAWSLDSFLGLDDAPTQGSDNLVKSGGVLDSIIKDGSAFDLSAYNNGATYADLSAALTDLNALPAAYKKGGMSIKFVQSSDNKYMQARCMANAFATDVTQWQIVENEPAAGSKNLVESNGIFNIKQDSDIYRNEIVNGSITQLSYSQLAGEHYISSATVGSEIVFGSGNAHKVSIINVSNLKEKDVILLKYVFSEGNGVGFAVTDKNNIVLFSKTTTAEDAEYFLEITPSDFENAYYLYISGMVAGGFVPEVEVHVVSKDTNSITNVSLLKTFEDSCNTWGTIGEVYSPYNNQGNTEVKLLHINPNAKGSIYLKNICSSVTGRSVIITDKDRKMLGYKEVQQVTEYLKFQEIISLAEYNYEARYLYVEHNKYDNTFAFEYLDNSDEVGKADVVFGSPTAGVTSESSNKYCSFIKSYGITFKGTGNAEIPIDIDNISKDFYVASIGVFIPWEQQENFSEIRFPDNTHLYGKENPMTATTYSIPGDYYQRVNIRKTEFMGKKQIISIYAGNDSEWEITVTSSVLLDDMLNVTPVCIVYDGGKWGGTVDYNGTTMTLWNLHKLLNIPYGIAHTAIYVDVPSEAFKPEVIEAINNDLAEVCTRILSEEWGEERNKTDIEIQADIEQELSDVKANSRGIVLGGGHFTPQAARIFRKMNLGFVRLGGTSSNAFSQIGDQNLFTIIPKNLGFSYEMVNPILGFPLMYWAHGVGTDPQDETSSIAYLDPGGVNTIQVFEKLLEWQNAGKCVILRPSEFIQFVKSHTRAGIR